MKVEKVSRADLEAAAHEQYRQRYAERETPEPKVINASPLVSFAAPRAFDWGGVGYWAPPLSYEDGCRLLVAAHALRDLRRAGAIRSLARATRKAAAIVRRVVRPTKYRPFWKLSTAFYADPPDRIEALIHWLLAVPDEAGIMPTGRPVTINLVGDLYAFQLAYQRTPVSWADYVYGMRETSRAAARHDLRLAVAVRMAGAQKENWIEFEQNLMAAAGW